MYWRGSPRHLRLTISVKESTWSFSTARCNQFSSLTACTREPKAIASLVSMVVWSGSMWFDDECQESCAPLPGTSIHRSAAKLFHRPSHLSPFASISSSSIMAAVYAVGPRPLDSVRLPVNLLPYATHTSLALQNPQAGPSASPQSTLKKKTSMSFISASAAALAAKRKRTDTPDETSAESTSTIPPRKPRDGPKKKKANRACYHCQKAHLTCDDCMSLDYVHYFSFGQFFSDTLVLRPLSTTLSTVHQARFRQQLH